ncbi:MAG: proline racemase family protein [Planctomycetaceae bacterium]
MIDSNQVCLKNVASFRQHANVPLDVETLGPITGDVAWGGNWFFVVEDSPIPLTMDNISLLVQQPDDPFLNGIFTAPAE